MLKSQWRRRPRVERQATCAEHELIFVAPDTSPRGEEVPDAEGYNFGQGAGFYVDATKEPWRTNYRMWSYVTEELPAEPEPTGLDVWSMHRSYLLSRANFVADYADLYANFFLYTSPLPYLAAWMYSPSLNGFTFIPRLRRESYYGNSFVPLYVLMPNVPLSSPSRVPPPQPPPAPTARPAPSPTPTPAPAPAPTPPAATPPAVK